MGTMRRLAGIVLICTLLSLAAAVTAASGTIQLNIHPGGGTVCLGTVCKENPATADGVGSITFENLDAGRYYMVNVYGVEGYKPYLKQVYLDPLSTALTRDITLEPIPSASSGTGSVKVHVTPDGGRVCLDRMCEVSRGDGSGSWSVEFTDVSANTYHMLSINNEGYETYTLQVRLLPGETKTMTLSLLPLSPGSTTPPTPTPPSTTEPQPTPAADLPGPVALFAIGICGIAVVLNRRGSK